MRVFAGPNGSGKTTIIQDLKNQYSFGVYVNADDIEAAFRESRRLGLKPFELSVTTIEIQDFLRQSTFAPVKLNQLNLWSYFYVENGYLCMKEGLDINSYIAADIAEFFRQALLENGLSFTYETVMSHAGKVSFMQLAQQKGYRVYLYYIATNDPDININRVQIRRAQKGHDVSPDIIKKRYYKSLEHLKQAIANTDRAFLFDNSGKNSKLLAEITNGKTVTLTIDSSEIPNWFIDYVYENPTGA